VLRLVAATFVAGATPSAAQSSSVIDETGRLESVDVRIANPSKDGALNDRIISKIRAGLGRFPDDLFSRTAAEFNLAGARRGAPISIHVSA
jgi:hypothetical protein